MSAAMHDNLPAGAAVVVDGLTKTYGRTQALDGLTFQVPRGSIFGLLGPNGAGKSTALNILCGWLQQDAGSATVLGERPRALYRLGGRVAALPQDAQFPPRLPVIRQLEHFARLMGITKDAAKTRARRALERVGLNEVAHKRGEHLSHGMRKRAGIAQTLLGAPELIILDEPTAGLDPGHARQVKDLLAALAPSTTVLISSHNLPELQEVCTHGAILHQGRQIRLGSIAELTGQGTKVTIELAEVPPEARERFERALQTHFAADAMRWVTQQTLALRCASELPLSESIGTALRLLLQENAPILGLRRGTSLEQAFLQATGGQAVTSSSAR